MEKIIESLCLLLDKEEKHYQDVDIIEKTILSIQGRGTTERDKNINQILDPTK